MGGGHVMCDYIIYCNFFGYHIAQVIRWDPQTRNGGWVGACDFVLFLVCSIHHLSQWEFQYIGTLYTGIYT
jgi:hypothetical protein